jgi:hypothetical protein
MERGGGDARDAGASGGGAFRVGLGMQRAALAACAAYYCKVLVPYPRREHRPAEKYLALALLYKLPACRAAGLRVPEEHAQLRNLLPELKALKHYGLSVHKFTGAQGYVLEAAAHAAKRASPAQHLQRDAAAHKGVLS